MIFKSEISIYNLCRFVLFTLFMVKPSFCMSTNKILQRAIDTRTILTELVSIHTFKFLALLSIPLFFIILPIILFSGLALLFIPIPILSNPVTGIAAAIGRRHNSQDELEQLLHEIPQSRECIERISCEIGRSISSLEIRGVVDQTLNQLIPYLKGKWKSSIHSYVMGSNGRKIVKNNCFKYICNISSAISSNTNWNY